MDFLIIIHKYIYNYNIAGNEQKNVERSFVICSNVWISGWSNMFKRSKQKDWKWCTHQLAQLVFNVRTRPIDHTRSASTIWVFSLYNILFTLLLFEIKIISYISYIFVLLWTFERVWTINYETSMMLVVEMRFCWGENSDICTMTLKIWDGYSKPWKSWQ